MKIFATIQAIESRRSFAEKLFSEVDAIIPTKMSIADATNDLHDAFRRFRQLMEFATLQNADWTLYLEDDQELTSAFWHNLNDILRVGEKYDVDLFYLANRSIDIGRLGFLEDFRVNKIMRCSPGSHGLLFRTKHIPTILEHNEMMPVDMLIWKQLPPHLHRHYQICRPVMARHLGVDSSLHHYPMHEHMFTHPEEI